MEDLNNVNPWTISPLKGTPDDERQDIPIEPGTTIEFGGQRYNVLSMRRSGEHLDVKVEGDRFIRFTYVKEMLCVLGNKANEPVGHLTLSMPFRGNPF